MTIIAWHSHSEESRALAESLRAAIVRVHGSEKAGAFALGLTPPQLSRQLSGQEPFNLWRAGFSPKLLLAFMQIHTEKMGGACLTPDERNYVLGFIGLGKRKMARFLGVTRADERQAS